MAARAGLHWGRMICHQVRSGPQPSMRGGFLQLARDRFHVLGHQEDEEGGAEPGGEPEGDKRVVEAGGPPDHELRDQRHLRGEHHRR